MRIINIKSKTDIPYYILAFMQTDIFLYAKCSIATNGQNPIQYSDSCPIPDFETLSQTLTENDYRVVCVALLKETKTTVTLTYMSDSFIIFVDDSEPSKYEHIILNELKRLQTVYKNA